MKLIRFRVKTFRSIDDSGDIEVDNVTTLIGVNEAGKSNLLLALWKLNPAQDGEINLLADIPRDLYSQLRDASEKPDFIEAEFIPSLSIRQEIIDKFGVFFTEEDSVIIRRNYNGEYTVLFTVKIDRSLPSVQLVDILQDGLSSITDLDEAGKGELGIKGNAQAAINNLLTTCDNKEVIHLEDVQESISNLDSIMSSIKNPLKTSVIVPQIANIRQQIADLRNQLEIPHPNQNSELINYILKVMPAFVYYSTYGNLDSEIYLPHVVENLKRSDLTGRVAAQTRTLRVLFNFVNLDPDEILEMGEEPTGRLNNHGQVVEPPTTEQIEKSAKAKQERDVLLHSASTRLTKEFRQWWLQGSYIFDLSADGNHFRIWVSDDERPEKVELENRSTGLQWFLSFFLVFLVESESAHQGTVLLLDEAGLSLHAHSQRDLINFFENLSQKNQLIHTTHSPFLVDTDHVDRIRIVYADEEGHTVTSSNLRAGEKNPRQSKAIYAVHAALGLSVSDALLQGCHLVIVEGQADQFYLSAIKVFLIGQGHLNPSREIVFAPSGGVKGVTSVAALLAAKDEQLPFVLIDSDKSGKDFKKKLLSGQYNGVEDRICEVEDFTSLEHSEVEDLIPFAIMRPEINRLFRDVEDEDFEDTYNQEVSLIPQIENFAEEHGLELKTGWKVDLARQVKKRILRHGAQRFDQQTVELWQSLFATIYPEQSVFRK